MSDILLIGAGFSKNWDGLLATDFFGHLLGAPELDDHCRELLRQNRDGSFENTLSILQREGGQSLQRMEEAIISVFGRMNAAFLAPGFTLEVLHGAEAVQGSNIKEFLARFDAIFSLNQDLLLEKGYCSQAQPPQSFNQRWNSYSFPGMVPRPQLVFDPTVPSWCGEYFAEPNGSGVIPDANTQPIYKLHGSVNWSDKGSGRLLIMGGEKVDAINGSSLLRAYAKEFERRLNAHGTRLTIIGYGFGDGHINAAIESAAVAGGLKIFVIDPWGYEAPDPQRGKTLAFRAAPPVNPIQACIHSFSNRGLREIFGSNSIEREKVFSFFNS